MAVYMARVRRCRNAETCYELTRGVNNDRYLRSDILILKAYQSISQQVNFHTSMGIKVETIGSVKLKPWKVATALPGY